MKKSKSVDGEAGMNARITSHPIGGPSGRRFFNIFVNDRPVKVFEGETLAAALWANGFISLGHNPNTGSNRGLYCGIGHCYECRVTVDEMEDIRSCLILTREGMRVSFQKPKPERQNDYVD
jgi:sarcosine oxidase subunit alpha